MGMKLMEYYKYVGEQSGLDGRIKLSIETKLPCTKAVLEPDTPANIDLFKKAVEKITGKPAPSY